MFSNNFISEANKLLEAMNSNGTLDQGLELSRLILSQISSSANSINLDLVKDQGIVDVVGIGNTKMKSWFMDHPYLGGHVSAFELFENAGENLEVKFYHLSENASKRIIAGSVQLLPNWEDSAELTRNADWKVGIDFFLSNNCKSLMLVLSLEGNLRILEFSERITSTQAQIMAKLQDAGDLPTHEAIHSVLWNSLSIKEVNKEFYAGLAELFEELVAKLKKGNRGAEDSKIFASRLIGRLLFVWFLRKKEIIRDDSYFRLDNRDSTKYYETALKPLFFEILSTPSHERKKKVDTDTPYLNGGLFEAHENDWIQEEIEFPTKFFDRIYLHFEKFNFTTDESSPEFEQIAIDPEMLGRVFESLLATQLTESGETARKVMGAYYTPREIVSFMCKESLRSYLIKKLDNSSYKDGINKLLDTTDADVAKAHSNFVRDLWGQENAKIVIPKILRAIDEIRVIDPACGSGAFPLGMVQLLLKTVERLDSKTNRLQMKLKIISNSIYGVDIEAMAVEIAKLRTWLSIAVEVDSTQKIEPLPNLDFKYICANSLVPLEKEYDGLDFGIDFELAKKLAEIRQEYFRTSSIKDKVKLRRNYYQMTKSSFSSDIDKRTRQLSSFDPFTYSKPAEFFDSNHMFGFEFFDIVIGNPPYVSVKGISIEDKERFKQIFESATGRFNLFTLFIEHSIKLLSERSILCFIIPDGLFSHTEYRHIRKYIVSNATVDLAVLFSEKVFDAAVDTAIVKIQQGKSEIKGRVIKDLTHPIGEFRQVELDTPEEYIFPVQLESRDKQIISKISSIADPSLSLKEVFDLQQGIIYSGKSKSQVFSETANTKRHKPSLDGRDVLPFLVNWKEKRENRYIRYSNDLHRPRDEKLFLAPMKLVMPRKSTRLVCAVDNEQYYALNTAYVLVPRSHGVDVHFYCGILNSNLMSYFYKNLYFGWQVTIPALQSLPICSKNRDLSDRISKLSRKAHDLAQNKVNSESVIDELNNLVYELYGISRDEIEIIENSLI